MAPSTGALPCGVPDARFDAILALVQATVKVNQAALALAGGDR